MMSIDSLDPDTKKLAKAYAAELMDEARDREERSAEFKEYKLHVAKQAAIARLQSTAPPDEEVKAAGAVMNQLTNLERYFERSLSVADIGAVEDTNFQLSQNVTPGKDGRVHQVANSVATSFEEIHKHQRSIATSVKQLRDAVTKTQLLRNKEARLRNQQTLARMSALDAKRYKAKSAADQSGGLSSHPH